MSNKEQTTNKYKSYELNRSNGSNRLNRFNRLNQIYPKYLGAKSSQTGRVVIRNREANLKFINHKLNTVLLKLRNSVKTWPKPIIGQLYNKVDKRLKLRNYGIYLADSLGLGGTRVIKQLSIKKRWKLRRVTARFSGGIKINPGKILRQGGRPIYLRKLIQKFSLNEYQNQFKTKQKFKGLYGGLSEKSFRRLCIVAKLKTKNNSNKHSPICQMSKLNLYNKPVLGSSLIDLLERRLDVVLFRLKLAKSLKIARLLIKSGLVKVDQVVQKSPYFVVRVGSLIEYSSIKDRLPLRDLSEKEGGVQQSWELTPVSPFGSPKGATPLIENLEEHSHAKFIKKLAHCSLLGPRLCRPLKVDQRSLNKYRLYSLKNVIHLNNQRVRYAINNLPNLGVSTSKTELLSTHNSHSQQSHLPLSKEFNSSVFLMMHPTERQVRLPRTISLKTLKNYAYRY